MKNSPSLALIVLAAGKGTRMKSTKAKVLHEVFYRPMLHHVLDSVSPLKPEKTIVIVGHQKDAVEQVLGDYEVICCEQKKQNGTGHAALCAQPLLSDFDGNVMILCGDSPLLLPEHLEQMVEAHLKSESKLTIMTTSLPDPTNYGRIISDANAAVLAIVEEKDATPAERAISEINAGIYIGGAAYLFKALNRVTTDNSQQEMYLTDIVGIAVKDGRSVNKFEHPYPEHVLGVNSKVELAQAHRQIQSRRNYTLMAQGVTIVDPATTTIDPDAEIGTECCLCSPISIVGKSRIGNNCVIDPGVYINNSSIGNNVHIGANSVITDATVGDQAEIAPLTILTSSKLK